ncbi:MAG: hypothetical protein JXQ75_09925 [Phycisphaerae bacterium]|nr:hypothetical protein [Phycisphaerae bacterium]
MALLTAGILPSTTARRTEHVPVVQAYLVHCLGALATAGAILLLAAWESASIPATPGTILESVAHVVGSIAEDLAQRPVATPLIVASIVVGIEFAYVLLALLCSPWGAADEPLDASMGWALERAWLHTPHTVLVVLLAGSLLVSLGRARQEEFWGPTSEAVHRLAFHVRNAEEIGALGCFAAGTWWLWGLLRSIGTPRKTRRVALPPTCEACGYNLTSISIEGRCPECGEPVAQSLGPDARSGTLWQRRREAGRWRAWWRCAIDPIVRPVWFGRQLRLRDPGTDHRWFLAAHLPPAFLVAWIGTVGGYITSTGRNPLVHGTEVLMYVGPIVGYFNALFTLFLPIAAAGVIGIAYRFSARRNLTCGVIQAACYLSGYVVGWSLFAFAWYGLLFVTGPYIQAFVNMPSVDITLIALLMWLLPNLLCLAAYLWLISRVTSGARYANR